MKLTNQQIYTYTANLNNFNIQISLPVRINFFLQKNIQTLRQMAKEIEQARIEIAQHFGELQQETGNYSVPAEKMAIATREINDLFNLEQEVPLYIFKLDDFEGIELTFDQMGAIMFMIEE